MRTKTAPATLVRASGVLALALGALLASGDAVAAAPSFVIRKDMRIGAFAVKADGGLAGAIRAFGSPRLRRTGEACTAAWPTYGLTMRFYNLGGKDPCDPRYGRFLRAIIRGPRWQTDRGLRVGMSSSMIRTYYPRASFRKGRRSYWPSGWWLVTRPERFGDPGFYPGLLAATDRGRVSSFDVRYAAGGD
jgi:hypothetical protein